MKIKKIDGTLFEQMAKNALNNIRKYEQAVNNMNVFPVPDGDTGTNMRLTLENGVKFAKSDVALCRYLKDLSVGMLLGARGNSGVILSQIFKGIAECLSRREEADAVDLVHSWIRGYKTAYKAVVRPVEGTLLTVSREGAERIKGQVDRETSIETAFSLYLAEMKKSLSYTPEVLAVLKEAGVVDSGGMGYTVIVDGMLKWLYGEVVNDVAAESTASVAAPSVDDRFFNENSTFEFGYCMEFLLQLLNSHNPVAQFKTEAFIEDLKFFGDSLVVIAEGTRVKVHIHTRKPSKVISLAQEYGEFVAFKLENMQMQHNEHVVTVSQKEKFLSIIAVANGEGAKKFLVDAGCDLVIDGGATMNTSAQEFVNAFRQVKSENIVVLPNNKNIVRAAEQAIDLYGEKNITVVPTTNIAEGYYAVAMDVADSDDLQYRLDLIRQGAKDIDSFLMSKATRDCTIDGVSCRKDNYVGIVGGKVVCCNASYVDAVLDGLQSIDMSDKTSCIVFCGFRFDEEMQQTLSDALCNAYSELETEFVDGGQRVYDVVIGVV